MSMIENGFPERLKQAISGVGLTQARAAALLGVSVSGLKNWLSGTHEPSASQLLHLAEITRTDIVWLLKGNHPADMTASVAIEQLKTDRELMGRCIDAINKLYQELNMKIPMVDMGREAADLHDEIAVSGAVGLEEQLGAIRFAIAQRRRALIAAPPSSKQQGSA